MRGNFFLLRAVYVHLGSGPSHGECLQLQLKAVLCQVGTAGGAATGFGAATMLSGSRQSANADARAVVFMFANDWPC